jgi:hypothetical protein
MLGTDNVTVVADNAPDKIIVLFLPDSSVNVVEVALDVNAKVVEPVMVKLKTPLIALSISCKLTLVIEPHVPEFSPVACKFKPKLLNVLAILNSPYHFY